MVKILFCSHCDGNVEEQAAGFKNEKEPFMIIVSSDEPYVRPDEIPQQLKIRNLKYADKNLIFKDIQNVY